MTVLTIPLFPLRTVLFPGGALPLKVFEQRYMDMATACIRDDSPFGVCLIASGQEVGAPAEPQPVGTLARIARWGMEQLGVLQIVAHGAERFRVVGTHAEASGLLLGEVELLAPLRQERVAMDYDGLVTLLRAIIDDLGKDGPPPPYRYDDAGWVGYRFCEVLPIPNPARQLLLELDDAAAVLGVIRKFLAQKNLVR